jgi:hypothetical protein
MQWSNYDGMNIQRQQTILDCLGSNPGLTVYFIECCDYVNPTTVWIDLWQNITTVSYCQTVT